MICTNSEMMIDVVIMTLLVQARESFRVYDYMTPVVQIIVFVGMK